MLSPLLLPLTKQASGQPDITALSIHHIKSDTTPADLLHTLYSEFVDEVERGNTYPQEGPFDLEGFKSYFFPADVFVAIGVREGDATDTSSLEAARGSRVWKDCVYGFYYVSYSDPLLIPCLAID